MEKIEIYDSTLRDGSQMHNINFSISDRIKIIKKLDEFGIDYIEAGNPGSNPKEKVLFNIFYKIYFMYFVYIYYLVYDNKGSITKK